MFWRNKRKIDFSWVSSDSRHSEKITLNDEIVKYEAKELDERLSRFFAEIRKSAGCDYQPDILRVMLAALDRHFKQNDSKISIANLSSADRSWRENWARAFREKATENDQMQQNQY